MAVMVRIQPSGGMFLSLTCVTPLRAPLALEMCSTGDSGELPTASRQGNVGS